jgi:hypothetical protein
MKIKNNNKLNNSLLKLILNNLKNITLNRKNQIVIQKITNQLTTLKKISEYIHINNSEFYSFIVIIFFLFYLLF